MVEVFMPKAGMDMKEGTLIRWLKNVGDPVQLDEPIMEIETDKITMEAEAPGTGILLAKLVEDGTTVPVLQTIGYIGKEGEKIPDTASVIPDTPTASEATNAPAAPAAPAAPLAATPYAKKLAQEAGIDLADIVPSGTAGEILARDVEAASARKSAKATSLARKVAEVNDVDLTSITGTGFRGKIRKDDVLGSGAAAPAGEPVRIPLTPIRAAIARNMYNSQHSMAQTSDSVEIDVTDLMRLRRSLLSHQERLGTRITINDLLSYAAVKMIQTHPLANASYTDTEILSYPYVNLSMAVATDYGLTSPVVHHADRMSLVELSQALRKIVIKARERKLTMDDQSGATFTITNMGIFPVDNFNPILPSPQSCIIGFGRCVDKPAVYQDEICIRTMMVLSVTYDHRVFDGGEVGHIMQTMKEYIESPELFLVL